MSLTSFAKANARKRGGKPCSICALPDRLRREVQGTLLERPEVSHQTIVDYLISQGVDATLAKLQAHLRNGHLPGYRKRRQK